MMVSFSWEQADPTRSPPEVATLEAFLNTVDEHTFGHHATKPQDARELITGAAAWKRWLLERGLVDPDATVDADDAAEARTVRDGLRAWLRVRDYAAEPDSRHDHGAALVRCLRLSVDLEPAGVVLQPTSRGARAALERLLADLVVAQAKGTLDRLKICHATDCNFVYYDRSRSRTSRWCSMDTCGNRAKTRRYRARRQPG